jgi:hypothetical protein
VRIIQRTEARFDIGKRRMEAGKIRFLGQIAQTCAGLQEARSAVALDLARGDFQQR